jgi:hypothetical protein
MAVFDLSDPPMSQAPANQISFSLLALQKRKSISFLQSQAAAELPRAPARIVSPLSPSLLVFRGGGRGELTSAALALAAVVAGAEPGDSAGGGLGEVPRFSACPRGSGGRGGAPPHPRYPRGGRRGEVPRIPAHTRGGGGREQRSPAPATRGGGGRERRSPALAARGGGRGKAPLVLPTLAAVGRGGAPPRPRRSPRRCSSGSPSAVFILTTHRERLIKCRRGRGVVTPPCDRCNVILLTFVPYQTQIQTQSVSREKRNQT